MTVKLDNQWYYNSNEYALIYGNNQEKIEVKSSSEDLLFFYFQKLIGKATITLDVIYRNQKKRMDFVVTKKDAREVNKILLDNICSGKAEESFFRLSGDGKTFVPFVKVQA